MLKYLFLILIIIGLFLPFQSEANGFLSGPIVPCGTKDNPESCKLCHFFVIANNVIQFLVQLILIIAPIFILAGGIMILVSAGKPDQVTLGRKIITYTIIGVVIALLSWTILRTLFNALIGSAGFPWPWDNPDCPV